jgi:hypothetical protein
MLKNQADNAAKHDRLKATMKLAGKSHVGHTIASL